MALPVIIFNATTGSDTAASGAGPTTAVTATAAAHTGGSASTTITLIGSPDLTGVATDGSHCLWMKTASGRQFSKISGKGAGAVTVEDSFTIAEASAVNYAIGGKRATWNDADSRNLRSDAKAGWTIKTETDQTITSVISGASNGDVTNGLIRWIGSSDSIKTIIQSENSNHFNSSATGTPTYWGFENLKFENSNATKTNAIAINASAGTFFVKNCVFGSNPRALLHGFYRTTGTPNLYIENCQFCYCSSHGINSYGGSCFIYSSLFNNNSGSGLYSSFNTSFIEGSLFHSNSLNGINFTTGGGNGFISGNTIYNNGQNGIKIDSVISQFVINNNNITHNSAYGINCTSGQSKFNSYFFNNNLYSNTSGSYLNISAGANDLAVDPQYTDAANGDFSVGTNVKALGFPAATTHIGINSATHSYVDIGAAQRKEVTPTYANASDVRSGVDRGDGTTGTAAIPTAPNVRAGTATDATVGTLAVPAATNVRSGVAVDAGTGSLVVPAAANVRDGVIYDATTEGTLVVPAATDVRDGVVFDAATTGVLVLPAEEKVLTSDPGYGANGTELHGSATQTLAGVLGVQEIGN